MQYWVYILLCSDKSYYTGMTSELEERLLEHQEGVHPKCYTFKRRPVRLVYSHEFDEVVNAIAAEKQIKKWNREKKEALIKGDIDMLHQLSECRNDTHHKYADNDRCTDVIVNTSKGN